MESIELSRYALVNALADAMAKKEGYLKPESLAFRLANPGNLRGWKNARGEKYPTKSGYVNFVAWANGDRQKAEEEGWRCLKVQIGRYIDGRLHGGKSPTILEMIASYAPAADSNDPGLYARQVGEWTGLPIDVPLKDIITA